MSGFIRFLLRWQLELRVNFEKLHQGITIRRSRTREEPPRTAADNYYLKSRQSRENEPRVKREETHLNRSRGHEKSRSEQSRKCRAPPRSRRWPLRPACSSGLIITLCGRVPAVAHSRACCELCCSSVERRRLCLQAWSSDLGAGQNDYTKLYRFYFKV